MSGPDLRQQPVGVPAPWSLVLPFDTPCAYAGAADLAYDIRIHTNTSGNLYPFDAVSSRDASMFGGVVSVGNGCATANGFMTLRSSFLTNGGTNQLTLQWTVERGPSSRPAAILLGLTNPNLPTNLLCGGYFLYTDAAVMVISGATDSLGYWRPAAVPIAWRPSYAGAMLTSQAGAVDPGQPGLGVAASNGLASTVAPVPPAPQLARVYALSAPTATTGTVHAGYGLVTRFQF